MFPPRPKSRIRPVELPRWERQGGWAIQRKFNGTRTLIHVTPSLKVEAWRPGKKSHLQWVISPEIINQVLSLNIERGKEYWFDGELMNNKTSNSTYKNKIIFFDIIQAGRYFFKSPDLLGRQKLLFEICGNPVTLEDSRGIALKVTNNIWLAETFFDNFTDRWKDFIDFDEIEGLVLKRMKSTIDNLGNKEYDVDWQIRCRKEHRNYSF
jgi:hypothetical protein